MSDLVHAEEWVTVRARVWLSTVTGDHTARDDLKVARWSDGTTMIGPFLVMRDPLEAALAEAQLSFGKTTREARGVDRTAVQRVIVPSLEKGHPGMLVVWERRQWLPPRGPRLGLQRAETGVLEAPPVYLIKPDHLRNALERAPLQGNEAPRPGWDNGHKVGASASRRHRRHGKRR